MPIGSSEPDVERLRESAVESVRRAETTRRLAADIRRRRAGVVTRIENSVAAHTTAVWSSRAADQSRSVLLDEVGFGMWAVAQSLSDTSHALESRAVDLEADAGGYRRQADAIEAAMVVADAPDSAP